MINEISQGNITALDQLNDLISNNSEYYIHDFNIPKNAEFVFLNIIQDKLFTNYHAYFNLIEILTNNKLNCFRFISIGLEKELFNLISQQEFDEIDEDLLSFCCLHLVEFMLQSQEDQTVVSLSFFIQTKISIHNKLNFITIYSKHCIESEDAKQIAKALKTFTKYLGVNPKVCLKFAWIIYYISGNKIENATFFINFFKKMRFPEYETNELFLKPYLALCQILLKNLLSPSQDEIKVQVVDYLFDNQNDLFEIAYSIKNREIVSSAYSLLKLMYKTKIENEPDKAVEITNSLVETKYFDDLIESCADNEYDIIESKIMLLSVLIPFINQIEKILLFTELIPNIAEMIGSGSDYRPNTKIVLTLIEKLQPYPDHFHNILTLLVENQFTEQVKSTIYNENLSDEESLDICNTIDQICIDNEILISE